MTDTTKIRADLHVHTVASGHAYSTVMEVLAGAQSAGLQVIGITDHGPGLPGGPHPYHFWNLRVIPSEIGGMRVLRGVEASIQSLDGDLDLGEDFLCDLDLVQVALHGATDYSGTGVAENTRTYIKAMENPRVQVISHPHSPHYPVDCRELVKAAQDRGVLIELNNASLRTAREGSGPYVRELAETLLEAGSPFLLASDAHIAFDIGRVDEVLAICDELQVPRNRILNFSPADLLSALGLE